MSEERGPESVDVLGVVSPFLGNPTQEQRRFAYRCVTIITWEAAEKDVLPDLYGDMN